MKKLFLIDAMAIVFRAYHAMAKTGMRAANGELTGAIFGFANILQTIVEKEKPDYLCIAFDTASPTFRHIEFEQYKAHRPEFPPELVSQLGRIKELISALNIRQIEAPGFEADDIIGTLAVRGEREGYEVYCVTPDKDYCQLVTERVKIYRPAIGMGNYEVLDTEGVRAKFGVAPNQVIDVLAIIGDASDNIPGVKGVGEKTAIPLVQQYGSLEEIYAHLDEIPKESVRSKFVEHRDIAFLSKHLVTIHLDVPLELNFAECARPEPNHEVAARLFDVLGFRRLREKFGIKAALSSTIPVEKMPEPAVEPSLFSAPTELVPKTIADNEHDYILVNSSALLEAMLAELRSAPMLAFDCESTSLNAMTCDIVGISFCARAGKAYYVPLFAPERDFTDWQSIKEELRKNTYFAVKSVENQGEKNWDKSPKTAHQHSLFDAPAPEVRESSADRNENARLLLSMFKSLLESPEIPKCGQNAKFDALILRRYDIYVAPIAFDTMLASYVLNPDTPHNMDALSRKWLNYEPIPISALIGEKKSTQGVMSDVPVEKVAEYAAEDADVTFRLYEVLSQKLREESLDNMAKTIEFPLSETLATMEANGVAIDVGALKGISERIVIETAEIRKKVFAEAGVEFNLDSPKQLSEILFEKMQIPALRKTKTGYSTDAGVLEELAETYPIAGLALEYRHLMKLQSTYVESLPKMVNPVTGRIHTTFNQTIAGTGRLSSTEPNLQNIPIRSALGKEIRRAFVPKIPGAIIFSADYSQIEIRIMAHVCGDETLIRAFQNGLDIHAATAAKMYDIPIENVTSDMRREAKTVNFGIMYGQGSFGLAGQLGISRSAAKQIIENYFEKYAGIKNYIDSTIKQATEKGYAQTLSGRRRYFPDITAKNRQARTAAERAAVNMPIQGTAADMMKLAMISVHNEMKRLNLRSLMMLQVHDELVFEMLPEEADILPPLVKRLMENALPLGEVPVVVEIGVGKNWAEAH